MPRPITSTFCWLLFSLILSSCGVSKKLKAPIAGDAQESQVAISTPYESLGWNEEDAIDHLIKKLTFGITPGLKQEIRQKGINLWLTEQLNPADEIPLDTELKRKYPAMSMDVTKIATRYPNLVATLLAIAIANLNEVENLQDKLQFNEMFGEVLRNVQEVKKPWFYEMEGGDILRPYMKDLDIDNFMELMYQLQAQKFERAVFSPNQVEEKLTDFWFNHFNVSITRVNDVSTHVLSYERDAIRPNVLGRFENMLKATARHPAMLIYLDNTSSEAPEGATTLSPYEKPKIEIIPNSVRAINENYARELLELHTLGVDGGYTQKDIEETARVFTGWRANWLANPLNNFVRNLLVYFMTRDKEAVVAGGFFFQPNVHDAGRKNILGRTYPAGEGVEEGLRLLEQTAAHPSTAKHISYKMATYFTADEPDPKLTETLNNTFINSNGNIKAVMKAMVESPQFWSREIVDNQIRSPFEFLVASLRYADAQINDYSELLRWTNRMGQPLFSYQPPTGYPTEASYWLNETAVLQRIKFSAQLEKGKIPGVNIDNFNPTIAHFLTNPNFQKK